MFIIRYLFHTTSFITVEYVISFIDLILLSFNTSMFLWAYIIKIIKLVFFVLSINDKGNKKYC